PTTKSQFDVWGATMATHRVTFGTVPSRRQATPSRTRRPRPREKALPRRGTAGPVGGKIRGRGETKHTPRPRPRGARTLAVARVSWPGFKLRFTLAHWRLKSTF